jgi:hypothetical protein
MNWTTQREPNEPSRKKSVGTKAVQKRDTMLRLNGAKSLFVCRLRGHSTVSLSGSKCVKNGKVARSKNQKSRKEN